MKAPPKTDTQTFIDNFYLEHGKCCAGCDHWHWLNTVVGECHKSAPVSGHERLEVLGININASLRIKAGHPYTPRDHVCGDFVDTYNWKQAK